ncbi:MAG: hypothetical protein KGZ92_09360 [Firmicutes bacterium]|nr:hypothetical protein [Dethiobacter sp.]MBS3889471.1 hypothetical protein [Bacillota bacterium]
MFIIGMAMIAAKFGEVHLGGTRNAAKIGALAGAVLDGAILIWTINALVGIAVSPLVLFLLPVCFAVSSNP